MTKIHVERNGRIKTLLALKTFRYTFGFSLFAIIASIALPLWRLFPDVMSQDVVPLHYNIHYGVDWTGVWWQLFTLPLLGVIFLVINTLLALWLVKQNRLLADIALIANVVLVTFLFLAMIFVVSLNIVYG